MVTVAHKMAHRAYLRFGAARDGASATLGALSHRLWLSIEIAQAQSSQDGTAPPDKLKHSFIHSLIQGK